MSDQIYTRYSEAFKLQVVNDIEAGKYGSLWEASQRNGITGSCTIRQWLKKYKKDYLMARKVIVQKPEESSEIQRLKAELSSLRDTVCHLSHKNVMLESTFETVCEMYDLGEAEAVAKKLKSQAFEKPSKKKRLK